MLSQRRARRIHRCFQAPVYLRQSSFQLLRSLSSQRILRCEPLTGLAVKQVSAPETRNVL
jgi:hypothetical protein